MSELEYIFIFVMQCVSGGNSLRFSFQSMLLFVPFLYFLLSSVQVSIASADMIYIHTGKRHWIDGTARVDPVRAATTTGYKIDTKM